MFTIKSVLVLYFMILGLSDCQRRIRDGIKVAVDRPYVVYLVKAPLSEMHYDNWICGGAIVSSSFVITSAACVNDVDYIYVIAGYKKYVADADIELDQCTSQMKKKVVYTCFPSEYEFRHDNLDLWSYIDVALAKVETPFEFEDPKYEELCSYKPTTIPINYDEKYQRAGIDALVLGWGHTSHWRMPEDPENYNQEFLNYGPTLLLNGTVCMDRYKDHGNMSDSIKTYMICTLGKGNIDDAGKPIQHNLPIHKGCTSPQQKLLGFEGVSCEKNEEYDSYDYDDTRRDNKRFNQTYNDSYSDINGTVTRRSGICQNDHGGPLVTWAGVTEILIGIASVFKVTEKYECMGPYLYTSTLCTGSFVDCILHSEFDADSRRRAKHNCDLSGKESIYHPIERTISWKNYPARAADKTNE